MVVFYVLCVEMSEKGAVKTFVFTAPFYTFFAFLISTLLNDFYKLNKLFLADISMVCENK